MTIDQLRGHLLNINEKDLPGPRMPGIERLMKDRQTVPENAMQSAVTLLIHNTYGQPSIVFIERAMHMGANEHRGQIAFPGGKKEDLESLKSCAFRETREEIGITLPEELMAQKLSPLYIPVSNFQIHPFLVFQDQLPAFTRNPDEVSQIIEGPLTDPESQYPIYRKDISTRSGIIKDIPYYPLQGKVLWGATALIFSELLQLIKKINS